MRKAMRVNASGKVERVQNLMEKKIPIYLGKQTFRIRYLTVFLPSLYTSLCMSVPLMVHKSLLFEGSTAEGLLAS